MDTIILYDKPECPFCWKVRLALAEAGLPVEIIPYQSPGAEQQWRALTPNNTVPVLQHGDTVIYESAIMLEYIADLSGQLLPEQAHQKVLPRQLHRYSDITIGAGLREVIFEKRDKPATEWNQQRINEGTERFHKALKLLAETLGDDDFFADQYGLSECALTARFGLAENYGVPIPEKYANLHQWFERMKKRPSYQQTCPPEPAISVVA